MHSDLSARSEYASKSQPYFGATVGRVANRIKNGKFSIGNQQFNTTKNRGNNTLHGGADGFNFVSTSSSLSIRTWQYHLDGKKVTFSYLSKDGEEGFPGDVLASVTYELAPGNQLSITMKATSTKQTPINMCNHSYFNLAGHKSGATEVYKHTVKINAFGFTKTDSESIPTVLMDSTWRSAAKFPVEHPTSGIAMEVHADQPGVQFYTGNGLSNATVGKGSTPYSKHGAFCLETQNYPDAVNHVKEVFGNQINLCRDRGLNPRLPAQKSDTLPIDHQVTHF
ncbi:unnamed protein product [Timema podura]|uniref:Galactose mutarotase n=1 Tax=Timema podura TaxID=61482 RepID=A0ABN7NK83_TIMPD|nr:unnamed protein product [Timema podura]